MFSVGVPMASDSTVEAADDALVERFGRVDGLVHLVGGWRGGQPLHEAPLADWGLLEQLLIRTVQLTTRAFHGQLAAVQGGVADAGQALVGLDLQRDEVAAGAADDDLGVGDLHGVSLMGKYPFGKRPFALSLSKCRWRASTKASTSSSRTGGVSGSSSVPAQVAEEVACALGMRRLEDLLRRALLDHLAMVEYDNGAALTFHTNLNVPHDFRRFAVIGVDGMAEGDFVRNYFTVTKSRTSETLIDTKYQLSDLSDHYGADEQMAADILRHLTEGAPLPVSVVDALEAGLLALTMDEARHRRSVIDMRPIWQDFDTALAGKRSADKVA